MGQLDRPWRKRIMKTNSDPNIQKIADILHENLCDQEHTERCGWFYDSWENPHYDRNKWYKKAEKVSEKFNADQVKQMFDLIYAK